MLVLAQTAASSGQIVGQVLDKTGAAVASAEVSVRSTETNQVRKTTSDGSGRYAVSLLRPGPYVVTAAAPGLTPAVHEVLVTLGGSTTATLTMTVAGVAEDVEVTAGLAPATGATRSLTAGTTL
jgi:uncharacterized surface anchored protein